MRRSLSSWMLGSRRLLWMVAGLLVAIVCYLYASAPASAEFSRPFESVIKGTPTGPMGELVPFSGIEGIATNLGGSGPYGHNVWIGDNQIGDTDENVLDEFDSSNVFLRQMRGDEDPPPAPASGVVSHSLAFDDLTGYLYDAGLHQWIAVDNSAGPATGDVYYATSESTFESERVQRFRPEGADSEKEPAGFTCSEPGSAEYVHGNELTGKPDEKWGLRRVEGVAVEAGSGESAGNIYVINNKGFYDQEVDEFTSAGCFVHAFKAEGECIYLTGVAVDPTNGDVLVECVEEGTIEEFASSGAYLGRITGASKVRFGTKALLTGGIAVGFDGDLYVGDDEERVVEGKVVEGDVVDVFGPGAFYPGVVTGGVSAAQRGSVVLNGVVRGVKNTEGTELELNGCSFEYVTEEEFEKHGFSVLPPEERVPCALGDGSSLVGERPDEKNYSVHADIKGLKAGTSYRYRLVAGTSELERGGVKEGAAELSLALPSRP